ncbi:MAG: hypothetical protein M0D54_01125 [Hyphomonadaceae bacterium JAD_PAG50586_4]|nr:MAG: hypothetical protein M0D54_01125 [Hyphomonadaceae bacterium JAD_PAG50586_4]
MALGRDLRGDSVGDALHVGRAKRWIEAKLQQQIRAMRNTVAPAFALIEATIIAHLREIAQRAVEHALTRRLIQIRLNAIRARDFAEHQCGERLFEAVWIGGEKSRFKISRQRTHRLRRQLTRAQPMRVRLERNAVAHDRVG